MRPCDQNLKQTLLLAERMIELADIGDYDREDTGCGILYGMLRDSGYKIKQLAESEKRKHVAKGWWDQNQQPGDEHETNATQERGGFK